MKQWIVSVFLMFAAFAAAYSQTKDVFFATTPAVSPDGKTVVFSYEGDLWKVGIDGGAAVRLTAMQGRETFPRISPDGKWLAFSSTQYGNNDVFVMPMDGGAIKQLTFHEAGDQVDSWSWDSQRIYFTSNRYNNFASYTVNVAGGTPQRVFEHFFNTVHGIAEHPTSGELFFTDTWESRQAANRKRYKGDYNPDIKSYNPKTREYKEYTNYRGKDFGTTIDRAGTLYFVSDEANGEYNLYTFNAGQKAQLTTFPTSIKYPCVSANGSVVVFERDYQLWAYDVASKAARKLPVTVFNNQTLEREQDFTTKGTITDFSVSPDNKKIAFVSRGELFVSDVKGKFTRNISANPQERVVEVYWTDNKTLLYSRTVTSLGGYTNWFTVAADGMGTEKQITSDARNNQALTLNKDRTKAVYQSGREEVRLLDLKTQQSRAIAKDEFWALYPQTARFSPDDKYVVFTAYRNFEQDIFVHNIAENKTLNLTNTGVSETSPYWSPDGKYIYFEASRTKPSYPFGAPDVHIWRMPLDRLERGYKSDKFAELFKEEPKKDDKKDDEKKDDKKDDKKADSKTAVTVTINTDGLMRRLERISPEFGSQSNPFVIQKDDKTTVLYVSDHAEGKNNLWKTVITPFESNKTEKIAGAEINGFDLREADGKYYLLVGGNIHKLDLEGNKTELIDISTTFRRDLQSEFRQMFHELWANVEENFYSEDFHGLDWKATRTRYAALLPMLSSRADLRTLLGDMLGELNSSHLGFNSSGREETAYFGTRTLATGIMFDNDKPYTVKSVVKRSPADVVGKDIRAGDVLVKVNGVAVNTAQNREFYFAKPSLDDEIELTFDRAGKQMNVKLHPQPFFVLNDLLYDEWLDENQRRVDAASKERIAYAQMKNMGQGALEQFLIEMNSELHYKDALILDLRYNTGGNVHDEVLKFLAQKPYLQWKYRGGKLTPQSNFAPAVKPIVLLINEQTLSDGEMTATGFKELKLGTVIGTETYRWIIFTSGKGLVDGSFYRLPSWGCYTLDGKNIEKEGVKPDVYVKTTFKDRLEGADPQLDRAIEHIMKQLK